MNPAPEEVHHPLLKAAEIEAALIKRSHSYNPDASTLQAPISDMVGMSKLGVSYVKLPRGAESTAPHFHLTDHEWVYILSGSGYLRLIDAGLAVHTNQKGRPLRDAAAARQAEPAAQDKGIHDEERHAKPAAAFAGFMGTIRTHQATAGDAPSSRPDSRSATKSLPAGTNVQQQEVYDEEYRPISTGDFAGFMGGVKAGKYTHSLVAGDDGMTYLMGGTRETVDTCSYPIVGKTIVFDDSEGETILTAVPRSGTPTPLPPKE